MNFNTTKNFEGHVFVKGMYNEKNCRNDDIGKKNAYIEVPFDMCNVLKTRSLNPKGIFISTTIVISFHSKFITKMDKAYRIQCFYMETERTVTTNIEVNDMTTIQQNYDLPLPVCKYEILNGGPYGEIVTISTIGNLVYHKWTCETENIDSFCMLIHSCYVDDGNSNKIEIIDKNGCSVDKALINNIEYTSDFVGGQLSSVYKYADRPQMYYQCQISINIKELYQSCPRPNCTDDNNYISQIVDIVPKEDDENIFNGTIFSDPEIEVSKMFRKRSLINNNNNILDVRTELTTVDITKEEKEMFCKLIAGESNINNINFIRIINEKNIICFSTAFFSIIASVMIINFIVLVVILIFFFKTRC